MARLCGIHLDLKYHMPNKASLCEWVRRLPEHGINAILIEYEDKFPYRTYPFLRDPDAFTPDELRAFLALARSLGLEVIPFVPTYAHLEFALAHAELAHLRERPEIMAKVCARNPDAVQFVRNLLAEVLEYHGPDRYVHLGTDEVWHTQWCDACAQRVADVGPVQMWAEHIAPLARFIVGHGKRPILFDDVFWQSPGPVGQVGLPAETVLHSWNYAVTRLLPEGTPVAEEMGGPESTLRCVDVYRRAGFDVIAGPCCNWGPTIPRHRHCLENTRAWAVKTRSAALIGMLNTAWAVYHTPLQTLNLHVAATGEWCRDPDAALDENWQEQWYEQYFGGPASGLPAALETLSTKWEVPMASHERPFTPLVYGYMNMVLHYPGGHRDRKRRGPYPLDWAEIDFPAMYRKGIDAVKQHPDQTRILAEMDHRLATFPDAVAAVKTMAARATCHRDEATALAVLAQLQHASLRTFAHLMHRDGNRESLRRDIAALDPPLREVLALAWEPVGRERMWRAWYEPMLAAL
jgi:hypothetical protein